MAAHERAWDFLAGKAQHLDCVIERIEMSWAAPAEMYRCRDTRSGVGF